MYAVSTTKYGNQHYSTRIVKPLGGKHDDNN